MVLQQEGGQLIAVTVLLEGFAGGQQPQDITVRKELHDP